MMDFVRYSHRWKMVPHTVTEIRREMNVRESRHTVMLFDRKYYNIDTGKYDTDRLPTLYHQSLSELVESGDYNNGAPYERYTKFYSKLNPEIEKWFTPKDDDFDDECKADAKIIASPEPQQQQNIIMQRHQASKIDVSVGASRTYIIKNNWRG